MDKIKYFSKNELDKLLKVIRNSDSKHKERDILIVAIGYQCALRVSEIGLIKVSDFNSSNRDIYCRRVKGSNNNTIRLNKEVARALGAYIKKNNLNEDDFIFKSQHGNAISRKTIDVIMKKYCTLAKIKDKGKYHFHVLKHTRAVQLLDKGFSLEDIKYILGHKNISNTEIYAQFSSNYKKDLFDRLDFI